MTSPGYRFYVGDLRTGKITRPIDLVGGSWSTPLGDAGSLEGSYPLRAVDLSSRAAIKAVGGDLKPRALWGSARSDAAAGKAFLAVAYVNAAGDETMLEAGPIWKSNYDDATGVLGISAAGLHSYFDHRKVVRVLAAGETAADVEEFYQGAQLGLIAKRLVQLAQTHTGGSLPIVLPSDAELGGVGTAQERTYPGYELAWIGDKLKELSDVEGGIEIQFVPRRRTDDLRFIEWVMRIGVAPTGLLTQSGRPWSWDMRVQKSDIRSLSVASDGTRMAFRQFAAGQGQAEGRPIAMVEDLTLINSAGFALLEGETAATDNVDDPDLLPSYASAGLAFSQRPVESWTVSVSRDGMPTVGQLRPGDWASFVITGHDYMPDGTYPMRILNIQGSDTDAVTLQLSERLGEL